MPIDLGQLNIDLGMMVGGDTIRRLYDHAAERASRLPPSALGRGGVTPDEAEAFLRQQRDTLTDPGEITLALSMMVLAHRRPIINVTLEMPGTPVCCLVTLERFDPAKMRVEFCVLTRHPGLGEFHACYVEAVKEVRSSWPRVTLPVRIGPGTRASDPTSVRWLLAHLKRHTRPTDTEVWPMAVEKIETRIDDDPVREVAYDARETIPEHVPAIARGGIALAIAEGNIRSIILRASVSRASWISLSPQAPVDAPPIGVLSLTDSPVPEPARPPAPPAEARPMVVLTQKRRIRGGG